MFKEVFSFLKRNPSLVITTHEGPDADGLGAEIAFSQICDELGIKYRILNSTELPLRFAFIDPKKIIKTFDRAGDVHNISNTALLILDCSDEYYIGDLKELIPAACEVFFIDHHDHGGPAEPDGTDGIKGLIDSTASSTCEIITELADEAGIKLNTVSCMALYAGISYDTGSFIYPKTTARTFRAALKLIEGGVVPALINHELNEKASTGALLLNQKVLSTLKIKDGCIAVQVLRREDLENCGARIEDAEAFINIPLKANDILVSVLVKETKEGQVRCSLRSKGGINVSKIAQNFGGGGHATASGFKSSMGIEDTLNNVLEKISPYLINTTDLKRE
ncbi:MAG: bifunctional oligoribonuclease/PAP phosphatase NrnA [Treponema sp.]|nr:bifunctional oligoribonuclease/PAP phosphatase NrnA [Treponema sp.]